MTENNDQHIELNQEEADRLTQDVFTPALQRAVKEARESGGGAVEMVHAAANAYQHLLVSLFGEAAAASMMRDHANHLSRIAHDRGEEGS